MTDGFSDANGPWRVEDLAQLPENGQRYEIIDGGLLVSPPPAPRHQAIAHRLTASLNRAIDPEWQAIEAAGVLLRRGETTRLVVPDIVVARRETVWAPETTTLDPSDLKLAVEIVSPSSVAKDRVLKPTLLAEAGIPAYWRVEQEPSGAAVVLYRLVSDVYKEADTVRTGEIRDLDWPVTCRLAPGELTAN